MEQFAMGLLIFSGCLLNAYAGYRRGLKKGIRIGYKQREDELNRAESRNSHV